jgi:hypothetical protein
MNKLQRGLSKFIIIFSKCTTFENQVSENYILKMSRAKILMYNATLFPLLLNLLQQMIINMPVMENINVMSADISIVNLECLLVLFEFIEL